MSYNIIGEQIQKYRKQEGMTQKELGEAIGVSSSAVSQWESGGTPDVSLLPSIADRLHVTIDMLFGREKGEGFNITEAACRWAKSLPEKDRLDKFCRLLLEMIKSSALSDLGPESVGYSRTGEMEIDTDNKTLLTSYLTSEYGEVIGIFADDISFISIFPEPEGGYSSFFSQNDEYRSLFTLLSEPNVLEVMQYFASVEAKYFTPGAIAKRMGLPVEEVTHVLEIMAEGKLLYSLDLESETGNAKVYIILKRFLLVPFFYFSRMMLQPNFTHLSWDMRKNPILR